MVILRNEQILTDWDDLFLYEITEDSPHVWVVPRDKFRTVENFVSSDIYSGIKLYRKEIVPKVTYLGVQAELSHWLAQHGGNYFSGCISDGETMEFSFGYHKYQDKQSLIHFALVFTNPDTTMLAKLTWS